MGEDPPRVGEPAAPHRPPTGSRIINALSAEFRKRIARIVAQGSAVADHEVDALGALSRVVQPGQADELVELAFQTATDPITTLTAAGAAGNARVTRRTAARITARTSALAADQLRWTHSDPKSLARAHAYLLGKWGQTEPLADLAGQASLHGVSPEWLTSFQWWLELPAWARPDPLPR